MKRVNPEKAPNRGLEGDIARTPAGQEGRSGYFNSTSSPPRETATFSPPTDNSPETG